MSYIIRSIGVYDTMSADSMPKRLIIHSIARRATGLYESKSWVGKV